MSLLRSSLVVSLISLLGSAISFANQLILASFFGASLRMDSYLIAVSLPLMVSGTISAVLSYTMVPALINHRSDRGKDGRFAGLIFLCLTLLSLLILLGGFLASPSLIGFFARSLPGTIQADTVLIARISWASAAVSILVGYLGALHNAAKHFYSPVLAGMLPYLAMIVCVAAMGNDLGPVAIAWGMFFGTCLAGILLGKGALRELEVRPACLALWPAAARYFSTTPLVLMAMGCFTVYQSIDAYWATRIGPGNMAYLGYCQRLLTSLGTLVIAGPSVVLVPRLTEACREGRRQDFLDDLGRALRMVLIFSTPLAVVLSILAVPVVELLFQRGAFDSVATRGVVSILPFMLLGMVAMVGVVIVFRALYAKHDFVAAALLGTITAVLYFVLSGFLSEVMQVRGIAIAYAISWWLVFAAAVLFLWRDSLKKPGTGWQKGFLFQLACTVAVTGLVVYLGGQLLIIPLHQAGFLWLALRTVSVTILGVLAFYISSVKILKMTDARFVFASLK